MRVIRLLVSSSVWVGIFLMTTAWPAGADETHRLPGTLETAFMLDPVKMRDIRVAVQSPTGPIVGDILYLHGFADRLDNHGPLFDEWNRAGFRVLAFDFPSHGESAQSPGIDGDSFEDLARLALQLETLEREDSKRPLILAGWSTGGLLATRIAQEGWFDGAQNRPIAGLILFAPGIVVRPLVGKAGLVTQSTLTRNPNPPHLGAISPASPLLKPLFAASLLKNATLATVGGMPRNLPVLTILGGYKTDKYVQTAPVKLWVKKVRKHHDPLMFGMQCLGAYHELDNEDGFANAPGPSVRTAAASFAAGIVSGIAASQPLNPGICEAF